MLNAKQKKFVEVMKRHLGPFKIDFSDRSATQKLKDHVYVYLAVLVAEGCVSENLYDCCFDEVLQAYGFKESETPVQTEDEERKEP